MLSGTNIQRIKTLYALGGTFFNREEASAEQAYWLSKLAAGNSRGYVLSGFVNSKEFDMLCDSFGIIRGSMREDGIPYNPGIRPFVERQYTKVLNRREKHIGCSRSTMEWTGARCWRDFPDLRSLPELWRDMVYKKDVPPI